MSPSNVVLLVEDDASDAEMTLRMFRNSNVLNEIVVVRDGVEAFDYLYGGGTGEPGLSAMPELILLDLKLPKVDGLSLLRRLQTEERTRRIPVVVLTSSNDEKLVLASYDLGAKTLLRKPFSFAQFIMATRQLGLYWRVLGPDHATRDPTAPGRY